MVRVKDRGLKTQQKKLTIPRSDTFLTNSLLIHCFMFHCFVMLPQKIIHQNCDLNNLGIEECSQTHIDSSGMQSKQRHAC